MDHHLWLFALLVFGIIVLPGMDMAFVLASSLLDGRRAGFAAVSGIVAGGLVHVAMSFVGIGLLLQAFPAAFNALLLAGSLYIGWIGWSLLRGAGALGEIAQVPSRTLGQTFGRALATCLLNPKAYVFMLAVFPQFMRPADGRLAQQALVLALIIALTQVLVYGAVALGAGSLKSWLGTSARGQVLFGRTVGLLLLATSAWALWQGWAA